MGVPADTNSDVGLPMTGFPSAQVFKPALQEYVGSWRPIGILRRRQAISGRYPVVDGNRPMAEIERVDLPPTDW